MRLKTYAAALGFLLGGAALGQVFNMVSVTQLQDAQPADLMSITDELMFQYQVDLYRAQGAPQVSQAADELDVRLQYVQIRQNQEIIRLLTELNRK